MGICISQGRVGSQQRRQPAEAKTQIMLTANPAERLGLLTTISQIQARFRSIRRRPQSKELPVPKKPTTLPEKMTRGEMRLWSAVSGRLCFREQRLLLRCGASVCM